MAFLRKPDPCLGPQLKVLDEAVRMALRDPVGLPDFALRAHGAGVLKELTTPKPPSKSLQDPEKPSINPGRSSRFAEPLGPDVALTDDMHIGKCWSVPDVKAQLGIRLSEMIYPTHVSIDHIPAEIAADAGAAPRSMVLWGAVDGPQNEVLLEELGLRNALSSFIARSAPPVSFGYIFIPLAAFDYDIHASSTVQTFPVHQAIIDSRMYVGVVVLEITDNWGGNGTCLYRIRVHGHPLRSP
ncbi:hypothetical protein BV20DRAFT_956648 [Pilatotrama ljubarskyi]|nr:hypothetical protein BV20DRAFT_956648 [Pilatotrama ljubarskyi]